MTPLKNIIDQTVNLFASDTFITGTWQLTEDSVVLVPEGTDTSSLKDKKFHVVTYNKSKENSSKCDKKNY